MNRFCVYRTFFVELRYWGFQHDKIQDVFDKMFKTKIKLAICLGGGEPCDSPFSPILSSLHSHIQAKGRNPATIVFNGP